MNAQITSSLARRITASITMMAAACGLGLATTSANAQVAANVPANVEPGVQGTHWSPQAQAALLGELRDFSIQVLDLPAEEAPDAFNVTVDLGNGAGPQVFQLRKHSVRTPDYELLVPDDAGGLVAIDPGPVRTYRGANPTSTRGIVTAALYDRNRIEMRITDGEQDWYVEPVSALTPGVASHVVYAKANVLPTAKRCGNDEHTPVAMPLPSVYGDRFPGGNTKAVMVMAANFSWIAIYGNIPDAQTQLQSIMNSIDAVYSLNAVSICYATSATILHASPFSPQPTAGNDAAENLRQIENHAVNPSGLYFGRYFHNLQLFTGEDLQVGGESGVVGLGRLGAIVPVGTAPNFYPNHGNSSNFGTGPYTIVEDVNVLSRRVELSCHEIGHNWGAQHCSTHEGDSQGCTGTDATACPFFGPTRCGIMTACLSSFSGDTSFAACSGNTITITRNANAAVLVSCTQQYTLCANSCDFGSLAGANASVPAAANVYVYRRTFDANQSWAENILLNRPAVYRAGGTSPVLLGQ